MGMKQQRENSSKSPSSIQNTSHDVSFADSLVRVASLIPDLPKDALKRVLQLVVKLPSSPQGFALRIIASKISSDFAMRFLLAVEKMVSTKESKPGKVDSFDLTNTNDVQVITNLLMAWSSLPYNIFVRNVEDFERFLKIASGLQVVMEATPQEERSSWVFDSALQFHTYLKRANLISPTVYYTVNVQVKFQPTTPTYTIPQKVIDIPISDVEQIASSIS